MNDGTDTISNILNATNGKLETRYTVHGRGAKTLRLRVELNFKSEHFLEKISKKAFKNGPKYFSFAKDIYTSTIFLQKVLKPVFQNPTVRGMCPPLISASQKSPKIRTNGRTDERTEHLVLTSRRT